MDEQKLLKSYAVEDLKAGMVVGKSVYDEQEHELIIENTVLTNQLIISILNRPIFSVMIREDKIKIPTEEVSPLDKGAVKQYEDTFEELRQIFLVARSTKQVDVERLKKMVDGDFMELTDGIKAITHVHNISREGDYLLHHSINVAILAGVLGKWLHFGAEELHDLILTGLMHDIGKTQIAEQILEKPGRLTEAEFKEVKQHASKGFELLWYTSLREKQNILFGVLQHHERLDGSGYPARASKEKIHKFAKIIAIADVYDAMAANKVYAHKKSPFDIFAELASDMVNKFDTTYCVLFIKKVCHAMHGNWVQLSNGSKAKIIYIDESRMVSLPIVQCINGEFIDLNKNRKIVITELLSSGDMGARD